MEEVRASQSESRLSEGKGEGWPPLGIGAVKSHRAE